MHRRLRKEKLLLALLLALVLLVLTNIRQEKQYNTKLEPRGKK